MERVQRERREKKGAWRERREKGDEREGSEWAERDRDEGRNEGELGRRVREHRDGRMRGKKNKSYLS